VLDPTRRFSSRVENYVKYRPGYPAEIIPLLQSECGLTSDWAVADIGSGTGLLTKLFLTNGNRVYGVEPNAGMRAAGENALASFPNFVSVAAAAEATTLSDQSIDLIVAGQAFHWFDRTKARAEFQRILRPAGWVALIWNGFRVETSPVISGYQEIVLRYGTDYQEVNREMEGLEVESFFAPNACRTARFSYRQVFDFEGFKGRLLSASYAPTQDHPSFGAMINDLQRLFDENQRDGTISFDYQTEVFYGRL
jgi:SAM-dependent methyltransferase